MSTLIVCLKSSSLCGCEFCSSAPNTNETPTSMRDHRPLSSPARQESVNTDPGALVDLPAGQYEVKLRDAVTGEVSVVEVPFGATTGDLRSAGSAFGLTLQDRVLTFRGSELDHDDSTLADLEIGKEAEVEYSDPAVMIRVEIIRMEDYEKHNMVKPGVERPFFLQLPVPQSRKLKDFFESFRKEIKQYSAESLWNGRPIPWNRHFNLQCECAPSYGWRGCNCADGSGVPMILKDHFGLIFPEDNIERLYYLRGRESYYDATFVFFRIV